MCVLFAATYPGERPPSSCSEDTRDGWKLPTILGHLAGCHAAFLEEIARDWGGPVGLEARAPSRAHDPRFRDAWARYLRLGASPAAVLALMRMNAEIDVRSVLPTVHVPTLVLHRTGDRSIHVEAGRHLAEEIPGATFDRAARGRSPPVGRRRRCGPGRDRAFPHRRPAGAARDRVLATILFTDIVDSTQKLSELGDAIWKETLSAHDERARAEIARHQARTSHRPVTGSSHVRWSGPCGPLRAGDRRGDPAAGPRDPRRLSHGRGRDLRWSRRGDRRAHRRPRRRARRSRPGARVEHREGSGRGCRARVRGTRGARAQGRAGVVEPLRGRQRRSSRPGRDLLRARLKPGADG